MKINYRTDRFKDAGRVMVKIIEKFSLVAMYVCSTFCVIFFWFLLSLWNTPQNPVKEIWWDTLQSIIGKRFAQNWSLFAPNPISSDYIMLVKPVDKQNLKNFVFEKSQYEKGWIDISSPLWEAFHRDRFSSYDRISRAISGPLRTYLHGPSDLLTYYTKQTGNDKEATRIIRNRISESRINSQKSMQKIGSIALTNIYGDGEIGFTHFAVAIRSSLPNKWESRFKESKQYQDTFVGIFLIDKFAATTDIYRKISK